MLLLQLKKLMRSSLSAGRKANSSCWTITLLLGGRRMNHFQLGEEELFCEDEWTEDTLPDEEIEDELEGDEDDTED